MTTGPYINVGKRKCHILIPGTKVLCYFRFPKAKTVSSIIGGVTEFSTATATCFCSWASYLIIIITQSHRKLEYISKTVSFPKRSKSKQTDTPPTPIIHKSEPLIYFLFFCSYFPLL